MPFHIRRYDLRHPTASLLLAANEYPKVVQERLGHPSVREYKILLAIFWSSLARYYYFLTSSTWGMWHYELHLEEIERMPIRFPEDESLRSHILSIVDQLLLKEIVSSKKVGKSNKNGGIKTDQSNLEKLLDEAIFDLYELSEPEREQIVDLCDTGIEFFYNSFQSEAVKPIQELNTLTDLPSIQQGLFSELTIEANNTSGLDNYLKVFTHLWNRELINYGSELNWKVVQLNEEEGVICVIFSAHEKNGKYDIANLSEQKNWFNLLSQINTDLKIPYNSEQIFIDGIVRVISGDDIIIIKRNERRLWTRSIAREDVAALIVQAINLQETQQ